MLLISLVSVIRLLLNRFTLVMMLLRCLKIRLILLLSISVMLSLWLISLRKMSEYKYFTDEEFRKAVPSCSLSDMNEDFMNRLDEAREIAGVPFVINSAYRSRDYELSKNRPGTSCHCKGIAVDIRCITNDVRFRIVSALLAVGFSRIGIGSNFIHVDSGYPNSKLIWLYA